MNMQIQSSKTKDILCLGNISFVVSFPLFFWGERVVRRLRMLITMILHTYYILSNACCMRGIFLSLFSGAHSAV